MENPKVRGHENRAAIHPVWERVQNLFRAYFSGADVSEVVWEKDQSVNCDPVPAKSTSVLKSPGMLIRDSGVVYRPFHGIGISISQW